MEIYTTELQQEDVNTILNSSAFVQNIKVVKERDATSGTDYWITTVKNKDSDGNLIKLKRGFAPATTEDNKAISVRKFANDNRVTFAVNASIFNTTTYEITGTHIFNSQILNENKTLQRYTLGIKADNTLTYYNPGTSAQQMLADGCVNALTAFTPLISNGVAVSQSILDTNANGSVRNPRQVIGQMANKDLVFFTCEGRKPDQAGMLDKDVIRILLAKNVQFAYMLDGGGSTETVIRGHLMNTPIDDNGFTERHVPDFLYFSKEMQIPRDIDLANIHEDIGEVKKKLDDTTNSIGEFSPKTKVVTSLNDLKENGIYWINGQSAGAPNTESAWAVLHIQHSDWNALQLAIPYHWSKNTLQSRRTDPKEKKWFAWRSV
ncbi:MULTISPECIES: phosphodiester glycosidase family protein [Heyndrickxia]|uniref:phosphodiester glycosidase family protein n=1 Tax=Heyndrickxia TaxID=2837504 RepID=UPI001B01B653|nr:phosphodiester glycosidase family protein [Heyndrickxia oleronia]GIN38787.1 hypothetical protein J19TS1_17360 [Heyndrickxia oleronia]